MKDSIAAQKERLGPVQAQARLTRKPVLQYLAYLLSHCQIVWRLQVKALMRVHFQAFGLDS